MTAVSLPFFKDGHCEGQVRSLQAMGCWPRVLSFLLLVAISSLLAYSLFGMHGIFVNGSHKVIGLHKQCLWNETTGEMECFKHGDARLNINMKEIACSVVCVYVTVVLCLFALLSFGYGACFEDETVWKFGVVLVLISAVTLFLGLVMFLLSTAKQIHPADLGAAFWMCVAADVGLIGSIFVSWSARREQNQYSIAVAI